MTCDCATCDEKEKAARGCERETTDRRHWWKLEGYKERFKRCPRRLTTPTALYVAAFAGLVGDGVFPDAGGWVDQAAVYLRACSVVNAARAASEEKKRGRRNS